MASNRLRKLTTMKFAINHAKLLALTGPRIAAVLLKKGRYIAVDGYINADADGITQVALVTPDGRVWKTKRQSKIGLKCSRCGARFKSDPSCGKSIHDCLPSADHQESEATCEPTKKYPTS